MVYTVYKIEFNDEACYIGRTSDLKRRQRQHNKALVSKDRDLYVWIREQGYDSIELIPIKTFKSKVESKRYECYLILEDYFNKKQLKTKVPSITDR